MHIRYFKNHKGLPAAILSLEDTDDPSPTPTFYASYEIEIPTGHIPIATGYLRSHEEIETWSPSEREALLRFETGLGRLYSNLTPCFWSRFVDQMAKEIEERLQLREKWLRKQQERRQTQEAALQVQQRVSPPHEELA